MSFNSPSTTPFGSPSEPDVGLQDDPLFNPQWEEQFVLRVPPNVAEKLRKNKGQGVEFNWEDERHGTMLIDGERLPMTLIDLPCLVETHKTVDKVTYYKSGDLAQMILVGNPSKKIYDRGYQKYSGLTPPTHNIKKRVWTHREKVSLKEAENEVIRILRGGLSDDVELEFVDPETVIDMDDITETTVRVDTPGSPGSPSNDMFNYFKRPLSPTSPGPFSNHESESSQTETPATPKRATTPKKKSTPKPKEENKTEKPKRPRKKRTETTTTTPSDNDSKDLPKPKVNISPTKPKKPPAPSPRKRTPKKATTPSVNSEVSMSDQMSDTSSQDFSQSSSIQSQSAITTKKELQTLSSNTNQYNINQQTSTDGGAVVKKPAQNQELIKLKQTQQELTKSIQELEQNITNWKNSALRTENVTMKIRFQKNIENGTETKTKKEAELQAINQKIADLEKA